MYIYIIYNGKNNNRKIKGFLFVVTYYLILQELNIIINIIIKRNLNCLYADDGVKKLFSPVPIVFFLECSKIKQLFN